MTRVLAVGIDPYALRACASLGAEVVVVASVEQAKASPGWAGLEAVRPLIVQSVENVEFILSALRRAGWRAGSFDAATTTLESALVATATVACALDAPFLDVESTLVFRDKSLQKAAITAAGIPTAEYVIVDDIWADEPGIRMPWPKAVLKPVAGMGTYSTRVVASPELLPQAVREVRETAIFRTFMLEEFSPGSEWCLDGVLHDGALVVLSLGAYGSPCIDVVSSGTPLRLVKYPPAAQPRMYELGTELVMRCAKALGLTSGVFHLEAFYDPAAGSFRFGEMAARRGGGLIQEAVHYESGVDLALAAVKTLLGMRPDAPTEPRRLAGFTYIPAAAGTVLAMPRPEDFLRRPGVQYVRIDCPPGGRMGVTDNSDTRAARVLVSAETEADLHTRMDDLLAWAADRLVLAREGSSFTELWNLAANTRAVPFTAAAAPRLYTPR